MLQINNKWGEDKNPQIIHLKLHVNGRIFGKCNIEVNERIFIWYNCRLHSPCISFFEVHFLACMIYYFSALILSCIISFAFPFFGYWASARGMNPTYQEIESSKITFASGAESREIEHFRHMNQYKDELTWSYGVSAMQESELKWLEKSRVPKVQSSSKHPM